MKLDRKLFNSFFYPFLVGVLLSTIIVTIFLGIFANSYYDKKMTQRIIDLESNYAKINLNSVNIHVSVILLKIQASLNEQILFYQKMANKTKNIDITKLKYNNDKLKLVYDYDEIYLKNNEKNLEYMGFWYIDDTIEKYEDIKDNRAKKQIISFSKIMPNLYSTSSALSKNNSIYKFYYYFEETNILFSFPISYDYTFDYLGVYRKFDSNPFWCANEEGEIYTIYLAWCRGFYNNIQKAKSDIFDNNYSLFKNRTIFITNFYRQFSGENSEMVYTVGIKFYDPITEGIAYAFSDVSQTDLISGLHDLNSDFAGYFFIASVGFNNVFFFPQGYDNAKTITENIFKWDINFSFEEKIYFYNNVQKVLTSNYINQINDKNLFDEVFINGENSSEQYFFINNEKIKYSIYPIILKNLNGEKEHVLSIIYIYNNKLYLSKFISDDSSLIIRIILALIIFIIFGLSLLHIIYLTINALTKCIVIPIKNVNYMLKGINIGGKNRMNYLEYLKRRQDDNLEKLEKIYSLEGKGNNSNEESSNSFIINDNLNNNQIKEEINIENKELDNENNININNINDNNKEKIDINIDFNEVYDQESNYIENENNFYDFDDALLQYRSLEIEKLVNLLIDIKEALILTRSDQSTEQIINYSYSEDIFNFFKNKEGASICQSNIGNLQNQLLKFDKAIYHLAISLEDNKLKRFLSISLSDELDERDSLLNKISYYFNESKIKQKNNILIEKQQRNTSDNFSQKIIGILINTRYCKLVYSFFHFFKGMRKLNKLNYKNDINGQFISMYFHDINYYQKILIQYIYLSYTKNDLIKIGESILDYIEFLIEFKFKTSKDKKYILNIQYRENKEYRNKQKLKKIIFDKIINWFNLFDDYIIYVKNNTSLSDYKNIINDYNNDYNNKDNLDLNSSTHSAFLFRVNIQRGEFLKGKFAFCCKNYNDALFYFIRSAKKKSIVIDGLIKKRSLKKIFKILKKLRKKYEQYRLINLSTKEYFKKFERNQHKTIKKKLTNRNNLSKENSINKTFREEIQIIKNDINKDINECNANEAKDIIILIDFNIYTKSENDVINMDKIDSFISQTKTILNNYLSSKDRLSVFIYTKHFQIICPLMFKYQIDIHSFSKDLINYKSKIFKGNDEYDINFEDFHINDIDLNLAEKELSEKSLEEESSDVNNKTSKLYKEIEGLIEALNYIKNYFNKKECTKNEKYIILFTDLFNTDFYEDENITNIFKKLKINNEVRFLLVGKNKDLNKEKNEDNFINKLVLNKFGEKSEIIYCEDMNKIKTILSFNNVIKDEIIYPNEIYK